MEKWRIGDMEKTVENGREMEELVENGRENGSK